LPYLRAENLSYRYPSPRGFALHPVNLSVEEGESLGLLGPNGSGKSTLLKLMVGLLEPRGGNVFLEGRPLRDIPVRERARRIAYVPQSPHFPFPLGVWEIVEMGRHPHLGRFQPPGRGDRAACERALELCDALDFKHRSYGELSGGERQRVLLASALAQTPQVLLLDEPTLSLDLSHQVLLFEIIRRLQREEGLSLVVATHELNLAGRFLDRLAMMKEGRVEAEGTPGRVLRPSRIKKVLNVEVEVLDRKGGFPYFAPKTPRSRPAAGAGGIRK
jgi:cobalamin transport system ATP-binding protein